MSFKLNAIQVMTERMEKSVFAVICRPERRNLDLIIKTGSFLKANLHRPFCNGPGARAPAVFGSFLSGPCRSERCCGDSTSDVRILACSTSVPVMQDLNSGTATFNHQSLTPIQRWATFFRLRKPEATGCGRGAQEESEQNEQASLQMNAEFEFQGDSYYKRATYLPMLFPNLLLMRV